MNFVVAVSGGVDSVVLLDKMAKKQTSEKKLIVAHFDHGIRDDSAADAEFVRSLAEQYGLPYETKREELGSGASEELARERRYEFLRSIAKKHKAKIVTAHHADDIVETIAINLTRGTGWRGLAVLDSPDIVRPLLEKTKQELIDYAQDRELKWQEDATNSDTKYLRNDIRQQLARLDSETRLLFNLYRKRQVALKAEIDRETMRLVGNSPYDRHRFIVMPEKTALELLRAVFVKEVGQSPTIPQRQRALHAIKTYQAGKRMEVAKGLTLVFTKTTFIVANK